MVLDSLNSSVSKQLLGLAQDLFGPNFQVFRKVRVQQLNCSDCGVASIAFGTCLV